MTDIIIQVLAHIRGMWRFRWVALGLAWLLCMIGWGWVYTLPNRYESSTRVYVDTDSALRKSIEGIATNTDVRNKVRMMTGMLKTRPNLEKVARETDLDLRAGTPEQMDRLINRLQQTIQVRSARNNVYDISYRDTDPLVAQAVVQTLLSDFVNNTLAGNAREFDETLRFLEDRISDYEDRLSEAEQRLADFKKKNVGRMPGSEGGYYERLQSGMARLKQLESDYRLAQSRRDELERQIDGEEPVFDIMPDSGAAPIATGFDSQISELNAQLSALSQQYTDKHPDITSLRSRIEILEAQRDAEVAIARQSQAASGVTRNYNPLDVNPVFQTLRVDLARTEVEVSQLRVQLTQQRAEVKRMQQSVDTLPEVEAQLARLNRDYSVTKARYETLLGRLETARMGDQANNRSDDVRFQVMEPPSLPLEPAGPDRFLFLSVVFLASLAGGAAFTFLLNQIKPVFNSRNDLRRITGLPVLGSFSAIVMPRERRSKNFGTAAFAMGLLLLAICYGGAILFEEPAVEFVQRVL